MKLRRRAFLRVGGFAALLATLPRAYAKVFGYPRALQGPMVGSPGPEHVTVWVRASGEFEVELEVSLDRDFRQLAATSRAAARSDKDFCAVLCADGLKPDTSYWYRLKYAGENDRHQFFPYRTKTAPDSAAQFRVAFGSCCRIQFDSDQRIWNAVRASEPDLFLWVGDNIYADSDHAGALVDLYGRGRAVETLQPLLRTTPQLATWDDHDFGYNDSDGRSPVKAASLSVFRNFWANPSYGEADNPGVYFKQQYGGVDFFMLDGRYHRDPSSQNDDRAKTMLGTRQKAWLMRELKASSTPFKVLAIGGGWSSAENEKGGDSWGVYLAERNELFDFIRDNDISGVVCISGDSHMGELNCIPRSAQGGYDIYDFCSSPLAQMPADKKTRQTPELRIRDVWVRSVNFGCLTFDMTAAIPSLTCTLHDVQGESVWEPLVLTPADLVNGQRSWDRKADPQELRRLERFKRGGGYYGYDKPASWPSRPYSGEG